MCKNTGRLTKPQISCYQMLLFVLQHISVRPVNQVLASNVYVKLLCKLDNYYHTVFYHDFAYQHAQEQKQKTNMGPKLF